MSSKTFDHFPSQSTCPVCGLNEDKPCVLVGIDGTEDGGNEQAKPVHVDCLLSVVRYSQLANVMYVRCQNATP